MPFTASEAGSFNPLTVPTVAGLMHEVREHDVRHPSSGLSCARLHSAGAAARSFSPPGGGGRARARACVCVGGGAAWEKTTSASIVESFRENFVEALERRMRVAVAAASARRVSAAEPPELF